MVGEMQTSQRIIFYSNKYGCTNFLSLPFEEGRRITYDYLRLEVTQEIVNGDEFDLRNHSFCDKHNTVEDERDCPAQTLTRPTLE